MKFEKKTKTLLAMVMYQSSLTGIFQTLFIEINANPSHRSLPFLFQD